MTESIVNIVAFLILAGLGTAFLIAVCLLVILLYLRVREELDET